MYMETTKVLSKENQIKILNEVKDKLENDLRNKQFITYLCNSIRLSISMFLSYDINYIIGKDEIIKYIPMFNFETVKQICIEDGIPEPKKDYVWWVSKGAPYGKRFCEYNCEVRIKVLEGIIKRLN